MNRLADLHARIGAPPVWLLASLGLIVAGNLITAIVIGTHPDEAYYWTWSVYPDLGYFDHPPMVGWMLWLIDRTIGIGDLRLRLPAMLSWAVGVGSVYWLATRLFPMRLSSWLAVLFFCALPVFQAASHTTTPDAPLLLFTSLMFVFLYRAMVERHRSSWWWTGLAMGGAFLSKYNAALIPAMVALGLLTSPQGRRVLRQPWPWLSLAVAAVAFLPVVIWNYRHDWASFAYQLGHGIKAEQGFRLDYVWIYVGGQLGSALLWVLGAMMVASFCVRDTHDARRNAYLYVLVTSFWFPLVFFGYAGGTAIGEVNWPAMAYFPGVLLLTGWLGKAYDPNTNMSQRRRTGTTVAIVVTVLVSVYFFNMLRFPLAYKRMGINLLPTNTQISDTYGWPELADALRQFKQDHGLPESCRVAASTKYVWASMTYQFRDVARFAILTPNGRMQYDFWLRDGVLDDRSLCAVIVRLGEGKPDHPKLREWPGRGRWQLDRFVTTPTSDTTRVYGFYLPAQP